MGDPGAPLVTVDTVKVPGCAAPVVSSSASRNCWTALADPSCVCWVRSCSAKTYFCPDTNCVGGGGGGTIGLPTVTSATFEVASGSKSRVTVLTQSATPFKLEVVLPPFGPIPAPATLVTVKAPAPACPSR